jgi:transposase
VLGALDAVTRQVHWFTNETYITATRVCSLLSQVAAIYAPRKVPITLFLDNARYPRCPLVMDHAKALGLELALLPSYSPHLKLIERDWRWVKKRCLNARSHPDFEAMKNTILNPIASAHHDYAAPRRTLLSWKFQLFSKIVVI